MTTGVADAPPAAPGPGGGPRRRRRVVVLAVAVAVAAGLGIALVAVPAGPPARRLAAFSLPRLGGGPPVTYRPAPHGTPVVLTLFGSWCPPCHKDLPVFARTVTAAERAGVRVEVLGIDGNDYSQAAGAAFAHQAGVTFPVAYDENQQVAVSLGFEGMPDTVFVAGDGTVVHTIEGDNPAQFNPAQLRHWLGVLARSA